MTTILVVDDDPKIRSVLGRGLRFEGYDVQIAASGQEALQLARDTPFDLVVLDLTMPRMDAWRSAAGCAGASVSPSCSPRVTR